jgi:SAM-dependent methyltransferase
VLEAGDATYTERFGGSAVTQSDVLHATGAPDATIVADLADAPAIPDDTFDCIILTQTLHYVFDMKAAVSELHRILRPGGRVLCTVPGISQISRWDMDRWGDRWRLTTLSARELFETSFPADSVEVSSEGNVLTSVCLLEGIVAERLRARELDHKDEDYQLVVTIVATKDGP